jgi:hypothetical protein
MFTYFSVALIDNTSASDATQLLIFIQGVNDKSDVITKLLSIGAMKGMATGKDLYEMT